MAIKTVHITNYYHKNSGGISTAYNNLLAGAARHQRYVSLIVPGEKEDFELVNDFAKIYYVKAIKSPVFDRRYRVILPHQYLFHHTVVRNHLLGERADVIEICDKYSLTMLAAMIRTDYFAELGRPLLINFSCERMDDNIGAFVTGGRFGKWISRRMMANYNFPLFDFHIANSDYTAEELRQSVKISENIGRSTWFMNKCSRILKASRIPVEERISVCAPGVDNLTFTAARNSETVKKALRRHANVPDDSLILLYAGRISPEKNIGLLVDMMRVLSADTEKDFRLVVAGAGPQKDWLQKVADTEFPGKIVLLGHLDKELLADYYANCDVFVHPNPREPFGISPLEAMASGVPVVAPNSGGVLSYATKENAWLTEPDGSKFANAVKEIINNRDLSTQKTTNAVLAAQENTWDKSIDRLFATYDRMHDDFQNRFELFTGRGESANFDFAAIYG